MKKGDYQSEKKRIDEQAGQLKSIIFNLREEYIETNSDFEVGQKVEITIPERKSWNSNKVYPEYKEIVFISGYDISYRDDVVPRFLKCKKDGNPSKHRADFREHTSIKAI